MGAESKIAFLGEDVSAEALLASIAERDGLEAVVVIARVNGCWQCCWSSGATCAGLSMAALKLLHDVSMVIHGDETIGWTPPEDGEVA